MKLFLDDIRYPHDAGKYMFKRIGNFNSLYLQHEWNIVRNYNDFCKEIKNHYNEITHISFDHDLADDHYDDSMYKGKEAYEMHISKSKEKTGYDCAKFVKQFYKENNISLPIMFVHSMNPVGTQNIINLFNK